MLLLICDANILIDIETGGLVAPMFSLDYTFVVPDVLFIEELESSHGSLLDMGLESRELSAHMVGRVEELSKNSLGQAEKTCSHWCLRLRRVVLF